MSLISLRHGSGVIRGPSGVPPDVRPSNRQHAYQAAPGAEKVGPHIARHPALCHDASKRAQLSCVPHFACSMLQVLTICLYGNNRLAAQQAAGTPLHTITSQPVLSLPSFALNLTVCKHSHVHASRLRWPKHGGQIRLLLAKQQYVSMRK